MKLFYAAKPRLRTAWLWTACALSLVAWVWAAGATWQAYCGPAPIAPCSEFGLGLGPLAVAAGYWAIGIVAWRVGGVDAPLEFFLVAAVALATGLLSAIPLDAAGRLFYVALAWLGPLIFHAHYQVIRRPLYRAEHVLLLGGYAISGLLSLPFLCWPIAVLQAQTWYTLLWMTVRLSLTGFVGLTLAYLGYLYASRAVTTGDRQRLRILFFGVLLAFAPLLLLSLLPHTLGAPFHVPYIYTFPALLLSPLAYLYVQFRPRLLRWEPVLQRSASYYLLLVLLSSLALVLADRLARLLPVEATTQFTLTLLLAVVSLAFSLLLLLLPVQWVIGWVLNGNERHLLATVQSVTTELAHTLTLSDLHRLLRDCLVDHFGCTTVALYVQQDGDQPGVALQSLPVSLPVLPLHGRLFAALAQCAGPVETSVLAARLAHGSLAAGEQEALLAPVALWLPLRSASTLQGVLALGPRRYGELFTARERQLLMTLAYQAAATLHNVQLMAAANAAHNELIQAHYQLLQAREQERRHMAAELHDGILQQLLGISYQLHRAQRLGAAFSADSGRPEEPFNTLNGARQELASAINQLRSLLGALHPADLEVVGLRAALAEYIERITEQLGPQGPAITFEAGEGDPSFPAMHQVCIYRCVQEALRNALRHAQAQHICVRLYCSPECTLLEVVDNGKGFVIPERLSQFARQKHFGLIGVEERVRALGGTLCIQSRPGSGTVFQVWIPCSEIL